MRNVNYIFVALMIITPSALANAASVGFLDKAKVQDRIKENFELSIKNYVALTVTTAGQPSENTFPVAENAVANAVANANSQINRIEERQFDSDITEGADAANGETSAEATQYLPTLTNPKELYQEIKKLYNEKIISCGEQAAFVAEGCDEQYHTEVKTCKEAKTSCEAGLSEIWEGVVTTVFGQTACDQDYSICMGTISEDSKFYDPSNVKTNKIACDNHVIVSEARCKTDAGTCIDEATFTDPIEGHLGRVSLEEFQGCLDLIEMPML